MAKGDDFQLRVRPALNRQRQRRTDRRHEAVESPANRDWLDRADQLDRSGRKFGASPGLVVGGRPIGFRLTVSLLSARRKAAQTQRMAMDRPLILPACSVRPFPLLLSDPCGLVTPIRRYTLAVAGCAPERDSRVLFDAWRAEA